MPQQFVIIARKNLQNPSAPKKFYALSRSYRRVTVEEICKRVGERSSFSIGELEGAINEFLLEIQNVLMEGSIAQIGKLGNFRLVLRSRPAAAASEFNKTFIKGCKVNFRPSTHLNDMCRTVKYTPYVTEKEEGKVSEVSEVSGVSEVLSEE